jgi:hypothetical protein
LDIPRYTILAILKNYILKKKKLLLCPTTTIIIINNYILEFGSEEIPSLNFQKISLFNITFVD